MQQKSLVDCLISEKTKKENLFVMKNLKKLVCLLCAAVMCLSLIPFAGCDSKSGDADKVMTLSLNPEVEFILDGNDKVISVNALNEEGNLIISATAFKDIEGKDASTAAKLFLQVSNENGFLVKGNAKYGENEIEISISGESVQKLYDKVKENAEKYLDDEKISAKIDELETITRAELEELLEECLPYLEEAEIKAMEYKELLKELANSRKETAEFYSQELKNAYYQAKAFALEKAELETLKNKANEGFQLAISVANSAYVKVVDEIEQTRLTMLVNEGSPYQVALKNFMEKKAEFLNYRNYIASLEQTEVTQEQLDRLDNIKKALDDAENVLVEAGKTANAVLDGLKANVENAYNLVISALETASIKVNDCLNDISVAQKTAINDFTTEFENDYSTFKTNAVNSWNNMRTALEKGYQPE